MIVSLVSKSTRRVLVGSVFAFLVFAVFTIFVICTSVDFVSAASTADGSAPGVNADVNEQSAIAKSTEAVAAQSYFEKVGNRLLSLDIKIKARIIDFDYIEGLKIALNYIYEIEPSYTGEFHLRMDRMVLATGINVGELLNQPIKHVGVELAHGAEILYVRPFKTKVEALKAVPFGYTEVPTSTAKILERFPLSAKNVIEHLAPGDFFSFQAHLDLVVGLSTLPLAHDVPVRLFTNYLISGQFQIYLIKGKNQRLFLKIVALRKNEWTTGVISGLPAGYNIFGVDVVDRRIVAVTNLTTVFRASTTKLKSNLLMVNYVLDMKNEKVQEAYDGLVAKVLTFKTVAYGNPINTNVELTGKLLSDITPFEEIFEQEKHKPVELRTVDRNFRGKNDIEVGSSDGFKFQPIIFKYSSQSEYFENMLTSTSRDNAHDYYRLHTFQRTNTVSWWFSYFKGVSVSRAALLFDSNKNLDIGDVRDIAFEWNYRDKALTVKELRMIKDAVRQALPANIYKTVDWGAFNVEQEYANARFFYKMLLSEKALLKVGSLSSAELFEHLKKYIKTIPEPSASPGPELNRDPEWFRQQHPVEERYETSLRNIAYLMETVLHADPKLETNSPAKLLENKRRSDAFADLRFNDLFIEIGPGFLLSLLPTTELKDLVHFEVTMVADDVPEMKPFRYPGTPVPDRRVYQAASMIQAILTQNEFETITQMMRDADRDMK